MSIIRCTYVGAMNKKVSIVKVVLGLNKVRIYSMGAGAI